MPLVSVIMPVYNGEITIGSAIASVSAQTLDDWELIVVDDASTDDTVAVVEGFAALDDRVRLIRLAKNTGSPAGPRNEGIKRSTGRFLCFLDADDLWYREKLRRQIELMEDLGAAVSCAGYSVSDEDGRRLGQLLPPERNNYRGLLSANTIGCLTAMYDSKALGKRFFPDCGHEDYALWLEILSEGYEVIGLREILANYTVRAGSVSSNKLRVFLYFWNIYRHREGFSAVRSVFLCLRYGLLQRRKYVKFD